MKYQKRNKAIVLLEDGTIFFGKSIGIEEALLVKYVSYWNDWISRDFHLVPFV
jgi:hypothetical protein